jgi:SpoVK/Ycf46/Vps4 family AAA+-type ATPase
VLNSESDGNRNCLLHGTPGNGKTTIGKCIATHIKQRTPEATRHIYGNIYMVHLNTPGLTDCHLEHLIDAVKPGNMICIEDVDVLMDPRRTNSLTEAGFTELLQGMINVCRGKVVFMTTNHSDRLTERFKREGRIYLNHEITSPDEGQIQKYVHNIISNEPLRNIIMEQLMLEIHAFENDGRKAHMCNVQAMVKRLLANHAARA